MRIKIKVVIALVMAIAFYILGGISLFLTDSLDEIRVEDGVAEHKINETTVAKVPVPIVAVVCEDSPVSILSPTADKEIQSMPTITPVATKVAMASITINVDKKTRTYDIMEGVSEKILERNIGHLPTSALPGQEGVCVLMGHRDTDFKVLQYVNVGDVFLLNRNNECYQYIVTKLEIVNSDDELRFESMSGENLILVSCYPFRYTGHASQKFVVYARRVLVDKYEN